MIRTAQKWVEKANCKDYINWKILLSRALNATEIVILGYEESRIEYLPAVRKGLPGKHEPPLLSQLQEKGSQVQGPARKVAQEPPVLLED